MRPLNNKRGASPIRMKAAAASLSPFCDALSFGTYIVRGTYNL